MRYHELKKYGRINVATALAAGAPTGAAGTVVNSPGIVICATNTSSGFLGHKHTLDLAAAAPAAAAPAGRSGLWVPYQFDRSVYALLDGGVSWVASGPYSGCYFEVGQMTNAAGVTQFYAAHIAAEESGVRDDITAWNGTAKTVLFRSKISPTAAKAEKAIVFAALTAAGPPPVFEVTRVEYSRDMGSAAAAPMQGRVLAVAAVVSDNVKVHPTIDR